jgi:hypothetical protein
MDHFNVTAIVTTTDNASKVADAAADAFPYVDVIDWNGEADGVATVAYSIDVNYYVAAGSPAVAQAIVRSFFVGIDDVERLDVLQAVAVVGSNV